MASNISSGKLFSDLFLLILAASLLGRFKVF